MGDAPKRDGWVDHGSAQRKAWRALSYAQRLAWLEDAKGFVALAHGAARRQAQAVREADASDTTKDGLSADS